MHVNFWIRPHPRSWRKAKHVFHLLSVPTNVQCIVSCGRSLWEVTGVLPGGMTLHAWSFPLGIVSETFGTFWTTANWDNIGDGNVTWASTRHFVVCHLLPFFIPWFLSHGLLIFDSTLDLFFTQTPSKISKAWTWHLFGRCSHKVGGEYLSHGRTVTSQATKVLRPQIHCPVLWLLRGNFILSPGQLIVQNRMIVAYQLCSWL